MQIKTFLLAAATAALATAQSTQNNTLAAVLNATSSLSTLNSLLRNRTTLFNAVGNATNITVLAPSNNALARLTSSPSWPALSANPAFIDAFLSYHVINGSYPASAFSATPRFLRSLLTNTSYTNVTRGQVVEGQLQGTNVTFTSALKQTANVTTPNVNITNGVVHVIDNYLAIPDNVTYTAREAGLTSLVGALNATGLASAVNGASDITVFAPSNAAFQAIAGTLSNLTTAQAASIVQYHVLNGTVAYSSLLSNTSVKTLSGQTLNITVLNGAVFVNSARVIVADVLVANGVVHVLDSVLNPNGTATANAAATTPVVAFPSASSGTAAPFTSGVTPVSSSTALKTAAAVATGYSAAPSGALTSAAAAASSASASASATSSSSKAGAMPTAVGAIGAAALFGGAAMFANI